MSAYGPYYIVYVVGKRVWDFCVEHPVVGAIATVAIISIPFLRRGEDRRIIMQEFFDKVVEGELSPDDFFQWYYRGSSDSVSLNYLFWKKNDGASYMIKDPALVHEIFCKPGKEGGDFVWNDFHMSNDFFGLSDIWAAQYPISQFRESLQGDLFGSINDLARKWTSGITDTLSRRDNVDIQDLSIKLTVDVISKLTRNKEVNSDDYKSIKTQIWRLAVLLRVKFSIQFLKPVYEKWNASKFNAQKFNTDVKVETIKASTRMAYYFDVRDPRFNQMDQRDAGNMDEEFVGLPSIDAPSEIATLYMSRYGTAASVLTFAIFELARHTNFQLMLRTEIKDKLKRCRNDFTRKIINGMPYLNMVVLETLRMYPPVTFMQHTSPRNTVYKDPLNPGTEVTINEKGLVFTSVSLIHLDKNIYAVPEVFNPSRFTVTAIADRRPGTFLPFGVGPNVAGDEEFITLLTKIGLVNFFSRFEASLSIQTARELRMEPLLMYLAPRTKVILNLRKKNVFK